MITQGWYGLTRAIDRAVPCYSPVHMPPSGDTGRCGDCEGCKDYGSVEEALSVVEREIEAHQEGEWEARAAIDAYLDAKERHVEAMNHARRVVAYESKHNYVPDARNTLAWALVDIDESMREALTDDK